MQKKGKKEGGYWLLKMLFFLCLALIACIGYSVFKVVYRKNQVEKEISALKEEASRIERENNDLKDKISYFETRDFQEKEVKDKLGLQNPDENLVVVKPELAREKQQEPAVQVPERMLQENVPNYKKWLDYFFKY